MDNYKKILVALDFSQYNDVLLARAIRLATDHGGELLLAHVVEYLPPLAIGDEPFPSTAWAVDEQQLLQRARERMQAIAEHISPLAVSQHVLLGTPYHELCELAREQKVDLMLAGSHGRHGIARLLGSTAGKLVHHTPCDLLLVRIAG